MFFLFTPPPSPRGWNVLGAQRQLLSWSYIDWRNTKICFHRASQMEQKRGKCQFLKENCEFLSVIWVKWEQSVCSITLLYFSTFYSLFLPFFVLEIFKFKYDKVFVRHSASISKNFKILWFQKHLKALNERIS